MRCTWLKWAPLHSRGTPHYFFFQAEDGIRDVAPSRGLGDVYKRQEVLGAKTSLFDNNQLFVLLFFVAFPLVCGTVWLVM